MTGPYALFLQNWIEKFEVQVSTHVTELLWIEKSSKETNTGQQVSKILRPSVKQISFPTFFANVVYLMFSFQELRRDIQAKIGTRANFNIAQIEDYGGEIFLSEDITVYILQEAKEAFKRCQLVCAIMN